MNAVAGTGLPEPEPEGGEMFEDEEKDQFTEVPLAGTRLKFTGAVLVPEQITWPKGEAETVATGFI